MLSAGAITPFASFGMSPSRAFAQQQPSTPAAPFGNSSNLGGGRFGTPARAGFGAPATFGGFGVLAQLELPPSFGAPAAAPGTASPFGGAVPGKLTALD